MKKRTLLFIGFIFGCLWMKFKPLRRVIKDAVVDNMSAIPEDTIRAFVKHLFEGDGQPIEVEEPVETDAFVFPRCIKLVLSAKADVDLLMASMKNEIDMCGFALVADLNSFTGHKSAVNENWGWKSLDDVTVEERPDGWLMTFNRPRPI